MSNQHRSNADVCRRVAALEKQRAFCIQEGMMIVTEETQDE